MLHEETLKLYETAKTNLKILFEQKDLIRIPVDCEVPITDIEYEIESKLATTQLFLTLWKALPANFKFILYTTALARQSVAYTETIDEHTKINKGEKPIKALKKVLPHMEKEIEEFAIELSKYFNNATSKGDLILSIRPIDYVTLSDNHYNWSSCLSWDNEGSYRAGTLEMLTSPYVVVAYLAPSGSEDPLDKKWRQLFIVTPEVIAGSRQYPHRRDDISQIAFDTLRDLAKKNLNYVYDSSDASGVYFSTDLMYNDLSYTNNVFPFAKKEDFVGTIHYSGIALCQTCGEPITEPDKLECECCDPSLYCCECGERVYEEDGYFIDEDGNIYCDNCAIVCSKCGRVASAFDELDGDYYCSDCYEELLENEEEPFEDD